MNLLYFLIVRSVCAAIQSDPGMSRRVGMGDCQERHLSAQSGRS
jgi:hypothetical protein